MRDLPSGIEDSIRMQMMAWVRNWRSASGSNYGAKAALARALDVTKPSLGKILDGGGISFRTAHKFLTITGQDPSTLFRGRGAEPTE